MLLQLLAPSPPFLSLIRALVFRLFITPSPVTDGLLFWATWPLFCSHCLVRGGEGAGAVATLAWVRVLKGPHRGGALAAFSGGGKEDLGGRERNYCCTQLLTSMLESQAKAADRCCNPILDLQQMGGRQDIEPLKVNHTSVFYIKLGCQKFLFVAQDS